MRGTRVWTRLLGLQRTVVEDVWVGGEGEVVAAARPKSRERDRCGVCRCRCLGFDLGEGRRRWRALDLETSFLYVEAEAPRASCAEHGVVVCAVPWARHKSRFTRAFEDQPAWLAVNCSRSAVAELMSASSTHTPPRFGRRPDDLQRVVGREPGPEPEARGQKVGFEDRLKHDLRRRHHHPVGHCGYAKRPRLTRPARLGDVDPSQRPRPVLPGTQHHGEPIEELAHPRALDLFDGHAIDAGRPPILTDLAPSPPEHIAAGDLVKDSVETAILFLLGTAAEHALESTNLVHTNLDFAISTAPRRSRGAETSA